MLIWKYENMGIFPIAIILKKNAEKQSSFSSLLKLIDKCHKLISETVNTQGNETEILYTSLCRGF